MRTAAVVIMTVLITEFLLHNIVKMLCSSDIERCSSVNYRGKEIPVLGGMVFIPVMLVAVLLLLLSGAGSLQIYQGYLALVLCMGFTGVVDDIIGDRRTKGLINHIRTTFRGTMTTGFLKAFAGFAVSCIVSLGISGTFIEFIVNVLIISLFANTINLFDLRPGRAVKVFLAASFLLMAAAGGRLTDAVPLVILNLAALLYITYDLKEICMLGDTGANILGVTLGYYSSLLLGINSKLLLLTALVLLNAISEKVSISEIINSSRLLSYLDGLGRGHSGNK
jgi:hypothetical protein